MAIFCQASSDDWYRVFRESNPEQIDSSRHILSELYPSNVIRKSAEKDLPVIKEILDKLKPEDETDLIKRHVQAG